MEALHRSPSPRPEGGSSRRRGGFVFPRPLYRVHPPPRLPSAPAPTEPSPREPPSSCAGPFTLLLPSLPLHRSPPPPSPRPRSVLSRATPLLILLQTGSIPPPTATRRHHRRPSQSPLERYAPIRVYTLMYEYIYTYYTQDIIYTHLSVILVVHSERFRIPNARDVAHFFYDGAQCS